MMKQLFYILLLSVSVLSCDFIKPNKKETPLKPIDFTTIDAYPLLPECEDLGSRTEQKKCFYLQLSNRISTVLLKQKLIFKETIKDTVFVKIQITDQGKIVIKNLVSNNSNKEDLVMLHQIIYNKVITMPQIQPAIKVGIPVTTEFTLPIVFE